MSDDPRVLIDERAMSRLQIVAVGITVALNALDGFDVISISFAAPGIAAEWGINPAQLGVVLSMELIGMLVGSLVLGSFADRYGRRPLILTCLALMTLGMLMASLSSSLLQLAVWRVLTGLGIGGMLATLTAVAAEFSNIRRRNLSIALMVIGYSAGAVIGGTISAVLLRTGEWRTVFEFGAIATFLILGLVWVLIPESVTFLCEKQPRFALERVNRTLSRMNFPQISELPPKLNLKSSAPSPLTIFNASMLPTTMLATAAYLLHIITFYFILKWTTKIVVDMGFTPSAAATVLVWSNVGGIVAGTLFGLLAETVGLKRLTLAVLLGSFLSVVYFGSAEANFLQLSIASAIAGMFINAGVVGLYSIFAQGFPTEVRATGTGFGIGIGRGGAILSPIVAGMLFQAGFEVDAVALIMGAGSLIAIAAVYCLKLPSAKEPSAREAM